jgi:hypothetical protein
MKNTSTHRPSRLTWFLLGGLLLVASLGLYAQQRNTSPDSACLTPLVAADSSSSAAAARALLPLIPPATTTSPYTASLPSVGPLPSVQPPDPDGFKALYGYSGPFYNTSNLTGQVVVLSQTIYKWPSQSWELTGMVRNQTRCPVAINSLSAQLLGANGEVIGTATARVPVVNLRPGEPGPFTIQAPLPASAVKSVVWHVDSTPTPALARQFTFAVDLNRVTADGTEYDLGGFIQNTTTSTVRDVRAVAAWLDDQNRVVAVSSLQFDDHGSTSESVTLAADGDSSYQDSGLFNYTTQDPALAQRIGHAFNLALWGISK